MGNHAAWGGCVVLAACALAGCHDEHWLTYPWDDRGILCSVPVDDLTLDVPWDLVEDQMAEAEMSGAVLTLHAHVPGVTISVGAIERVLALAEARKLAFLTYRELADPSTRHRAGLAFAFDDDSFDAWFGIRDLLAAHDAHVTFFVTRWAESTDAEQGELWQLAGDGHDVEPHSVQHLHAPEYVRAHGTAAYLTDEFQPSIDALEASGYPPPRAYAYPFGRDTAALDAAILKIVPHVRVSPGVCPY